MPNGGNKDVWEEVADEAIVTGLSRALNRVANNKVSKDRKVLDTIADDVNSWIDFAIQARDPKLHFKVKQEGTRFKLIDPGV